MVLRRRFKKGCFLQAMNNENRKQRVLLLVRAHRKRPLGRILERVGLVPVFLRSMQGVLEDLHCRGVAAVVLDRDRQGADPLELLLNVREINGEVPVLVIGNRMTAACEDYMASVPGVYRAPRGLSGRTLETVFFKWLRKRIDWPARSEQGGERSTEYADRDGTRQT